MCFLTLCLTEDLLKRKRQLACRMMAQLLENTQASPDSAVLHSYDDLEKETTVVPVNFEECLPAMVLSRGWAGVLETVSGGWPMSEMVLDTETNRKMGVFDKDEEHLRQVYKEANGSFKLLSSGAFGSTYAQGEHVVKIFRDVQMMAHVIKDLPDQTFTIFGVVKFPKGYVMLKAQSLEDLSRSGVRRSTIILFILFLLLQAYF